MGLEEIRKLKEEAGKPKIKTVYRIPKKSKKRIAQETAEKEMRSGDETALQKFFKKCVSQMTGYCMETGLKTETKIFQYAIMSICHILPKASCKSVALHPANWIELNVDFHKKFDAMSWAERERMGCWTEIRDRLMAIWPDLAESERRHFPESVLNWMTKNDKAAEDI